MLGTPALQACQLDGFTRFEQCALGCFALEFGVSNGLRQLLLDGGAFGFLRRAGAMVGTGAHLQ